MQSFEQNMIFTLNKMIDFGNKIHSEYRNRKLSFPAERTVFDLCERTFLNLKAIKILIEQQESRNDLDYPIGLLIRNNVLDFLILFFVFNERITKGEAEMKNLFVLLQYDHFAESKTYLKNLKSVGFIDEKNMDEMLENIKNNYTHFFDFEKLQNKKFPTAAEICRKLYQEKETRPLAEVVYDAFKFYSNYEHYGFFYHELKQRNISEPKRVMKGCMEFCFKTFLFSTFILENESLYLEATKIIEETDWKYSFSEN